MPLTTDEKVFLPFVFFGEPSALSAFDCLLISSVLPSLKSRVMILPVFAKRIFEPEIFVAQIPISSAASAFVLAMSASEALAF